jgi:hypothetical protein
MGNSSVKLQDLVEDARSNAELAPAIPAGGFSDAPAISIANDVMQNMLAGGPAGQPFNWKWNRAIERPFFINSWQQDYFIPNQVAVGWLESCTAVNYSCTQFPKPVYPVIVKRDLLITFNLSTNNDARICWMQNDTMQAGTWGATTQRTPTGQAQPGPGVVYTDPSTAIAQPINPTTAIKDAFGNLWTLTQYGTCGNVNPFLTNLNPTFPTVQNQSIVSTVVTDGTVQWTAVNPKGQGYRINPLPCQTGPVWLIQPVGQMRVPFLNSLSQYLDPIPDDFYTFFKQGFFAQCYRRSPLKEVRAKFEMEWKLWQVALTNAVMFGANQEDDWGFVPQSNVMDTGYSYNPISPANPYGPWNY